jgi:hypothetical membrane protein
MRRIKVFRKIQTVITLCLFTITFFLVWKTSDVDLAMFQLSYWGKGQPLSLAWNFSICIMALSGFFNVFHYITDHPRFLRREIFIAGFATSYLFLFLSGIFDLSHPVHTPAALGYFLMYPLCIFSLAYFNRRRMKFTEWAINTVFATAMVILPLSFLKVFTGMALSEIIHIVLVFLWNIWLLYIENKKWK